MLAQMADLPNTAIEANTATDWMAAELKMPPLPSQLPTPSLTLKL